MHTFAYQKNQRYFAQIADGLEDLGKEELARLGATDVKPSYRGIYFSAAPAALYRVNYSARLISRVMAPLLTFDCHSDRYLYKTARSLPWTDLLTLKTTFAVFTNVANSNIRHSQYASQKLKDAIVDQFRDACGDRPQVEPLSPDVWINLYIHNNKATISLETSGGSLHRRGYRQESVEAPMQETVAAAVIQLSGWDGERPLYDPMCGSGTLLTEALMRACRIPSGYLRARFGFERLPDFDAAVWGEVKQECDKQIRPLPAGLIGGSDASRAAVEVAQKNCRMLPGGGQITIKTRRFQDIEALEDAVIICNPPYGVRMNTARQASTLLKEFDTFLKKRCQGSTAYVYLGKKELLPQIALRPTWKKPLKNGGLQGFLTKYEIAGEKKGKGSGRH
jgi:putative N6-adenine-specific DNA methylase